MIAQSALEACRSGWNAMLKLVEDGANRRAGEAQLRRMNDRELADLGLGRSGIEFAVRTEADPPHTLPSVSALRRLAAVRRSNSHIRRRLTVD